nr:unnamed protein product [Callosobruchus chinensis]CAH7753900.1 unnamed protein product [Callosobruchus chinensis]
MHVEFHHLYNEQLLEHPEKFYSYFRMNISTFDYILDQIEQKLLKKWTNFIRTPIISAEQQDLYRVFPKLGLSFSGATALEITKLV